MVNLVATSGGVTWTLHRASEKMTQSNTHDFLAVLCLQRVLLVQRWLLLTLYILAVCAFQILLQPRFLLTGLLPSFTSNSKKAFATSLAMCWGPSKIVCLFNFDVPRFISAPGWRIGVTATEDAAEERCFKHSSFLRTDLFDPEFNLCFRHH